MLDLKALAALQSLKQNIKEDKQLYRGIVRASGSRHGFVDLDKQNSYYLASEQMDRVLPGDEIEFSIVQSADGRSQAEIENLITNHTNLLYGRVQSRHQQLWLEPDIKGYQRWLLIGKKIPDLAEGQLIKAKLSKHPFDSRQARVDALELLGNEEQSHLLQHYLASREGLTQFDCPFNLEQLQAELENELKKRLDLTHLPFVTIDGDHTLDMDDAVFIQSKEQGFALMVAIADPSSLIGQHSELKERALSIGHSIYLPGYTINMLPDELSHGLCSLTAGEERLALVFQFELDTKGKVESFDIVASKIRSRARLNYDQVSLFMDGQLESLADLPQDCLDSLGSARALTQVLQRQRQQQALIGLERPDYELRLDDQGVVTEVEVVERNEAQKFIEELMLLTNQHSAQWLAERQTGIFTTNPGLREDRIADIEQLSQLHWAELDINCDSLDQLSGFSQLIRTISKHQHGIHNQMLINRLMSRTCFSTKVAPHFPLGFAGYSTVTSPIRKYNDLINHQLIHQCLSGLPLPTLDEELLDQLNYAMQRARKLEQEATQWLIFDWLKGQKQSIEATMVGVNNSGIQVQLNHCGFRAFLMLKQKKQVQVDNLMQSVNLQGNNLHLGDKLVVKIKNFDEGRKSILVELA